jgi:hypothetical protein
MAWCLIEAQGKLFLPSYIECNIAFILKALLNKQLKDDFGMILTGTSFRAIDNPSTIIDADAPLVLPLGINTGLSLFSQASQMLEWFGN